MINTTNMESVLKKAEEKEMLKDKSSVFERKNAQRLKDAEEIIAASKGTEQMIQELNDNISKKFAEQDVLLKREFERAAASGAGEALNTIARNMAELQANMDSISSVAQNSLKDVAELQANFIGVRCDVQDIYRDLHKYGLVPEEKFEDNFKHGRLRFRKANVNLVNLALDLVMMKSQKYFFVKDDLNTINEKTTVTGVFESIFTIPNGYKNIIQPMPPKYLSDGDGVPVDDIISFDLVKPYKAGEVIVPGESEVITSFSTDRAVTAGLISVDSTGQATVKINNQVLAMLEKNDQSATPTAGLSVVMHYGTSLQVVSSLDIETMLSLVAVYVAAGWSNALSTVLALFKNSIASIFTGRDARSDFVFRTLKPQLPFFS